jgi:hypothetical protein
MPQTTGKEQEKMPNCDVEWNTEIIGNGEQRRPNPVGLLFVWCFPRLGREWYHGVNLCMPLRYRSKWRRALFLHPSTHQGATVSE